MPSVDEKVVKLSMDDADLNKGTKRAINDLDDLKKALEFKDAERGLEAVTQAAARVDMNPLSNGIANVSNQFNLLNTIATSAIFNVTNKAIDAGEQLIKSLSVDQISAGWDKFADKTSAVQTIMASTSNQFSDTGKQMEYVEEQLEKLNWFTDETSYRFLDMVSNIGKFTASNIALDKSVDSMQGIAAWAARSGAGVQGASRAMYNLSQSMAMGAVRLQDWMSIENANMATYEFKETALETAVDLGVLTKTVDGLYQTVDGTTTSVEGFRESLQKGWFTADVLVSTLDKYGSFASELNKLYEELDGNVPTTTLLKYIDDFVDGSLDMQQAMTATGLSAEELGGWLEKLGSEQYKLGRESFKAAQETKTFQEAIDYVKESVSSGWMRTFEYLFGNYEEAKEFFSNMSEWLYDIFVASGDARNGLLMLWKDDGGRDKFIDGLYQVMNNISTLIETIREAWQDVFPPATVDDLMNLTDGFRRLIDILTPTEDVLKTIGNLVRMLATGLQTLKRIVSSFARGLYPYLELLNRLAGIAMNVVSALAEFSVRLMNLIFPTDKVDEFGNTLNRTSNLVTNLLHGGLDVLVDILGALFRAVDVFFTYVEQNGGGVSGVFTAIVLAFNDLVDNLFNMDNVRAMIDGIFGGLGTLFGGLLEEIQNFVGGVMGMDLSEDGGVKGWLAGVSEALAETDISGKLSAIVGGIGNVIGALLQFVADLIGVDADIRGIIDDLVTNITTIFDWIVEQLSHITLEDVKNVALVILLGEIVFSLKSLILGLKSGVGELTKIFKQVRGLLDNLGDESVTQRLTDVFSKTKWLQIALAIGILVSGLLQLSRIPKDELYQGVLALVAVLGMVMLALKMVEKMSKNAKGGSDKTIDNFVKTMSAMGIAIGLISMGVAKMASAGDPAALVTAVTALGAVMTELWIFAKGMEQVDTKKMSAVAGSTALLALGITSMIPSIALLGLIPVDMLFKGLTAVATLLVAFGVFAKAMENTDWKPLLAVVPVMMSFSATMVVLTAALAALSFIDPDKFAQGLGGVATMIIALGAAISIMSAAASGAKGSSLAAVALELIAFSAAIGVLTNAIKTLGALPADQLREGANAIGGAIAGITVAMSTLLLIGQFAQGAAVPLAMLAATILSIAAAFAAFGLAAAGIATVITAISAAFNGLVELGAKFGEELPTHINNAMDGVEVAINRLLGIIIQAKAQMVLAAVSLFGAILEGLVIIVPDIVDGLMVMLTEVLSVISRLTPVLMQELIGLIKGIADNIGPLFAEIDRLLAAIFAHLAITIHNLITDIGGFIYGIVTGKDFREVLTTAVSESTESALIEGTQEGAKASQDAVEQTMSESGENAATVYSDSAQDKIDETMPGVGEGAVNLFAKGSDDNISVANGAGAAVGNAYGSGAANSLESWKKYMDSEGLFNFGLGATADSKKEDDSAYVSPGIQKTLERRKKWEEEQQKVAYDSGYGLGDSAGSGIGDGLASSKAPSAAARSQAQNIGDAFTDEIKKLDLADKTANSLLSLWKAQNPNATEAETAAKEMELVAGQIVTQSQRAQIAQQQYTETLKAMGEASTETQEAYIKMIDEQTKLIELQNKLNEAQMQGGEQTTEAFQRMSDVLHDYYYAKDGGRSTAEFLKSLGFTDKEIAEAAAKEAGYAIPKMVEDTKNATVMATQSAGQQTVQLYAQSVTTNLEALTPTFTNFGNTYATSLGTGMTDKTADVGNAAVQTIDGARNEAGSEEMIGKWVSLGEQIDNGLISGIEKAAGKVADAAVAVVREALIAAQLAAKVASPSKETTWQAEMWMAGYVKGIENDGDKIGKAITIPIKSALSSANSAFDNSDFTEGFSKSIIGGVNESAGMLKQRVHTLMETTTDEMDAFARSSNIGANVAELLGIDDEAIHVNVVLDLDDSSMYGFNALVNQRVAVAPNQNGSDTRLTALQQSIQKTNARMSEIETRMNLKNSSGDISKSTSEEPVQNFNFTQNNYSPKALSRLDIRRDTERIANQVANKLRSSNKKLI